MSKGKVFLGTVVAAVAGFAAGILTAPKSGKETRKDIKDEAEKVKGVVIHETEKVKTTATRKANEVKAKAEEVASEVTSKAEELKERAEQAVKGAQKGFNKTPNKKK